MVDQFVQSVATQSTGHMEPSAMNSGNVPQLMNESGASEDGALRSICATSTASLKAAPQPRDLKDLQMRHYQLQGLTWLQWREVCT